MDHRTPTCTACFAAGSQTECRVFDNSTRALIAFSAIHAAGRFPFMCMQPDHRYRVCQQTGVTRIAHVAIVPLKARAA